MKGRTAWIGLFVACSIGDCSGAAATQPAAPPAGYEIDDQYTQKSPDGATTIEQYLNKDTDDWKWQFWVRRQGAFTRLDPEPAGYAADFIFTNDLKWIVRVQKIGSGTSTLHLYRLTPQGYSRASKKPLGVSAEGARGQLSRARRRLAGEPLYSDRPVGGCRRQGSQTQADRRGAR